MSQSIYDSLSPSKFLRAFLPQGRIRHEALLQFRLYLPLSLWWHKAARACQFKRLIYGSAGLLVPSIALHSPRDYVDALCRQGCLSSPTDHRFCIYLLAMELYLLSYEPWKKRIRMFFQLLILGFDYSMWTVDRISCSLLHTACSFPCVYIFAMIDCIGTILYMFVLYFSLVLWAMTFPFDWDSSVFIRLVNY